MAKSLDGIKKLNPEEIKKYRKIVLNYIGEKEPADAEGQKDLNPRAVSSRKVDGLNLNKASLEPKNQAARKLFAGNAASIDVGGNTLAPSLTDKKRRVSAETDAAEVLRRQEAIKRQTEERKMVKAEEIKNRLKMEQAEKARQEKARLEKADIRQEKIRLEESRRAAEVKKWEEKLKLEELERAERRRIKENMRLDKIKRQQEIKRLEQEMKKAKQLAEERKKNQQLKARKKFWRNFRLKTKEFYSVIIRNIFYIISFSIFGLAIVYVIFCLAVLRFKIDNDIINYFLKYVPVPAVISNQGVIGYKDYKIMENKNFSSLAEKKNYLAKLIILSNLRKKYSYPGGAVDYDLASMYVADSDYNQVGLSRINKINELLKGGSAIEQLGKYADEYNDGAYYDAEGAIEKFGREVSSLAVGQVSNMIYRPDGYYIIKRIDDINGQIGVKYLFIKAQTLDQYVNKKLGEIKVFILAN